ncbi:MAG: ATP-binding cassette domain-containing protein [Prevotella sp.]|nr:ATP-binding cassette domain-containing protein [Prevotella sp.]
MKTIHFSNVLPQVFSQKEDLLSDVWSNDVTFEKGKRYLLEADSGQGKSTFCSYVIGYRDDYSGSLFFDDVDTSSYRLSDWMNVRRNSIAYLFQELRLFPELTAMENVVVKNAITGHKSKQQIVEWFQRLGIADKMQTKVALMSFGQQQRVALMRALAQPFDFLIADEPISHLDDNNAAVMAEMINEEASAQGAAVIVTSIGKHLPVDYDKTLKL